MENLKLKIKKNMKRKSSAVLAFISLSLLTACGGNYEKGKEISKDEVNRLNEDKENDNKRFAVTGYPFIGGDVEIGLKKKTSLEIYTEPNGKGQRIISLPVDFGTGKNEFSIPENFTLADLKLYDNEGNELSYKDKAVFSYTLDLQTERKRINSFYFKKAEGNRFPEKVETMAYFHTEKDVRIDKAN
jgi:hypothetical protein